MGGWGEGHVALCIRDIGGKANAIVERLNSKDGNLGYNRGLEVISRFALLLPLPPDPRHLAENRFSGS